MEKKEIEKLFCKASKLDEAKLGYRSEKDWELLRKSDGIRNFKRRLMGFFGLTTIKSLEEIAAVLYETSIVDSLSQGRDLVPKLIELTKEGNSLGYDGLLYYKTLKFYEIQDHQGRKKYKVKSPQPFVGLPLGYSNF